MQPKLEENNAENKEFVESIGQLVGKDVKDLTVEDLENIPQDTVNSWCLTKAWERIKENEEDRSKLGVHCTECFKEFEQVRDQVISRLLAKEICSVTDGALDKIVDILQRSKKFTIIKNTNEVEPEVTDIKAGSNNDSDVKRPTEPQGL